MIETKIMITGVGIDLEGTRGDLTAYENALYLDLSDYMGVYIHKKICKSN